jgi:hypothetical protein
MTRSARRNDSKVGRSKTRPPIPEFALGVKTWGEIKAQVEAQGVTDDDPIFLIDLGPDAEEVFVKRDYVGQIEISDEPPSSPVPEQGDVVALRVAAQGGGRGEERAPLLPGQELGCR